MKTYWDLSEKERSELSEAGVEAFLAAELMTKGVLKVEPPEYEPEPPEALPPGLKVYRASIVDGSPWGGREALNVAFETEDQLRAFLALNPVAISRDYFAGDYREVGRRITHNGETEMKLVAVHTREQIESARNGLEKREAIKKANAEKRSTYESETKAQKEALEGLWADWLRCCRRAGQMKRIASTLDAYTATADGDRATALRFLRKVFIDDDIIDAAEWCGLELPDDWRTDAAAPGVELAEEAGEL